MAYIRKRAKGWRVEIEKNGVRDSDTFATKAAALAWGAKREAEILAGQRDILPTKYVTDALTLYAEKVSPTKKGERWEVLRLARMGGDEGLPFRHKVIHEVTQTDIAEWRDARLKTAKPSTFNREWNLLHNVFQIARREWRWLRELPFKDVKRPRNPKARVRRVLPTEHTALHLALGYSDGLPLLRTKQHEVAVAFDLAIETGMRATELVTLPADHVKGNVAHLPETKNHDARDVPLSCRAVLLVEKLRLARTHRAVQGKDSPLLFSLDAASLDALFRKARARAAETVPSITSLHFHDTRHEACTRLSKIFNVLELARVIGHRDLKSLMIYYNPTAEELAAKFEQVQHVA